MAKRFTGTEKWGDAWFCSLTPLEKLFWVYLLDTCDNAGIWQVNWPLVRFHLPDFVFSPDKFKGRYTELTPEKWFIPKFIGFQYLTLNPDNRAHQSVILKLQKEGVWKGRLASPLQGAKDKDKDKDKEQVVVREGTGGIGKKVEDWFERTWMAYPQESRIGRKNAFRHYKAAVKTLEEAKAVAHALENYLKSKRVKDGFIQNASTWFNNWRDWEFTERREHDERRSSEGFSRATATAGTEKADPGLGKPADGE